jgi:sugar lactone lactonase YvrE
MNDGGCDPQGRFYCGSMAYDATPGAGALFRLDPDLSVHRVLSGVTISNGIHWHRGGRLVYHTDTMTGRVDVYDFDPGIGEFSGRRVFTTIDDGSGLPDGMAIDEDGGVWVALWQGGGVRRYDERGRLSERIEVPVHLTTACTFGGRAVRRCSLRLRGRASAPAPRLRPVPCSRSGLESSARSCQPSRAEPAAPQGIRPVRWPPQRRRDFYRP